MEGAEVIICPLACGLADWDIDFSTNTTPTGITMVMISYLLAYFITAAPFGCMTATRRY